MDDQKIDESGVEVSGTFPVVVLSGKQKSRKIKEEFPRPRPHESQIPELE